MKTKKLFLSIAGVVVAMAVATFTADSASACVTCTSEQTCTQETTPFTGDWAKCVIFEYDWDGDGEMELWCNMRGKCNELAVIAPGDLSPAGTVLTDEVVLDVDGTTELAGCTDNIVQHSPVSGTPRLEGSMATL